MIFAMSGSTWKRRNALRKIVSVVKTFDFKPRGNWGDAFALGSLVIIT